MGFSISFKSTEPVDATRQQQVQETAQQLIAGRTWLSCEPPCFFQLVKDHLWGASKPNFLPHPDDVAAAASEGRPDGTVQDMLEVLCEISRRHQIDWEFSHSESPGSIGRIQQGEADERLRVQIELLEELCQTMSELPHDFEGPPRILDLADDDQDVDVDGPEKADDRDDSEADDDDDSPPTIRLWPNK